MRTVGTRELKQNPNAVIQRVLESGDELEITAYGRSTGVKIVPDGPARARWVSGAVLGRVTPMSSDNAERMLVDVETLREDGVWDPWEERA